MINQGKYYLTYCFPPDHPSDADDLMLGWSTNLQYASQRYRCLNKKCGNIARIVELSSRQELKSFIEDLSDDALRYSGLEEYEILMLKSDTPLCDPPVAALVTNYEYTIAWDNVNDSMADLHCTQANLERKRKLVGVLRDQTFREILTKVYDKIEQYIELYILRNNFYDEILDYTGGGTPHPDFQTVQAHFKGSCGIDIATDEDVLNTPFCGVFDEVAYILLLQCMLDSDMRIDDRGGG